MKYVIPGIAIALIAVALQMPVAAQCRPFSPEATCLAPAVSRFSIDFRRDVVEKELGPSQTTRILVRPAPADRSPQPVDCAMVKPADRTVDPQFVKPPAPGKYTARMVEVPPCKVK